MFKIVFQTGGFYRLFGVPMTLFADGFEESILVLGNPMRQLREQIANAGGFDEMVWMSEAFLLAKAARYKIEKHPIDAVLHQANLYQFSVDQLANDACLSTRQFERKFLERIGVSPKLYQRIVRFNVVFLLRPRRLIVVLCQKTNQNDKPTNDSVPAPGRYWLYVSRSSCLAAG